MPAIEVEALERVFEGGVRAVQGVDLEVADGEIYGFLGPNGAGKTTMVRMLTTLLLPTGGRARVAGHDVVREASTVRRSIGVALQEVTHAGDVPDGQVLGVEVAVADGDPAPFGEACSALESFVEDVGADW